MNTLPQKSANLSDAIDAVLPQTQCTRCGYPACRPYAEAIADGRAAINQCPPGGDDGIRRLVELTGQAYQPLNPAHGIEGPRQIAIIDEARCIGCTVCIKACPVDAILGGFKHMHTVLSDDCTGCELCVAPCPVDCIAMRDLPLAMPWTTQDAERSRRLYQSRQSRLTRSAEQNTSPTPSSTQLNSILERAKAKAQARLLGTTAHTNSSTSTQD